MSFSNPYAGVGSRARGDRFVGRVAEIQRVRGVWLGQSERPCNMSIIGNHKIGKSSLVERSLQDSPSGRADLIQVFIGVGQLSRPIDLFKMICNQTARAIDRDGKQAPRCHKILAAVEAEESWYGIVEKFRDFFETVKEASLYVLVVLDEFDRIRMDGVGVAHFQLLRDFCTEPWSYAGLITVSRQGVRSLELGATGGSSLDQVLVPRTYVGLFSEDERAELMARAGTVGLDLTEFGDLIDQRAGMHPYLTELLCFELVHGIQVDGAVDAAAACDRAQRPLSEFFARLLKIVDVDLGGSGVDKLMQVLTGIGLSVSPDDVMSLEQYGLIVRGRDDQYLPFSAEFGRYLKTNADGREFRGLWLDCEVGLRRMIRTVLSEEDHRGDFRGILPKSFDKKLERARLSVAAHANSSAAQDLDELDYLYPADLFQVVTTLWELFEPLLGDTREEWLQRSEAVAGARNTVMHSRPMGTRERLRAEEAAHALVDGLTRLGFVEKAP